MLQRTIDQKQMNITIVLGDKIPSIKYGGTQRVMWYLGKELDKRGHKVTFIAGKGSYCPFAKVIELDPAGNLNAQIPADTDLVHFNIPVPDGITKPHLLTIHGNGIPANADRNIVFVSRNHAQRLGSESFVYNGLDWDDYGPANLQKELSLSGQSSLEGQKHERSHRRRRKYKKCTAGRFRRLSP